LNWKLITVSLVAVISTGIVISSYFYSLISAYFGVIYSLLTLSTPFIVLILTEYLLKTRISLKIKNVHIIAKGFDQTFTGYQVAALITNKGKKICFNLDDVKVTIKDSKGNAPNLIKVTKKLSGQQRDLTLEEENFRSIGYTAIDEKGNKITTIEKLRKDDTYSLVFPYETKTGIENTNKETGFSSYYSEYLLDLNKDEKYSGDIKIKAEDSEKNTVSKSEPFNIKALPTEFTTTKDLDVSVLMSQIGKLESQIAEKNSKIHVLNDSSDKHRTRIDELNQTISKKSSETQQLSSQISDLSNRLEQAKSQVQRLTKDMQELSQQNESFKKKLKENPREIVK
jgi:hypothetical protein